MCTRQKMSSPEKEKEKKAIAWIDDFIKDKPQEVKVNGKTI